MLTIAFVLFALQLSATASPSPVKDGVQRISLTRRQPSAPKPPVDPAQLQQIINGIVGKYEDAFDIFKQNDGQDHPLSDSLTNNTKRAVGIEPLTNDGDALWTGPLTIGTAATGATPQVFTMGFDTGSASTFVVSSSCTTTACQAHARYNPAASSTARNLNKGFTSEVSNKESISGAQYSDTMNLATLPATGQVFGVANTYPNSFGVYPNPPDGRVGMAFQAISAYKAPSLPQTLVAQQATTAPVFTFRLTGTPRLTLGAIDPATARGPITYTPVTTKGFWQVKMNKVSVQNPPATTGGTASDRNVVGPVQAIIDTGSPLIIGDRQNVEDLYAAIPGSASIGNGMYTFPCTSQSTVTFNFGGTGFPLTAAQLSQGPSTTNPDQCVGAIVAAPQTKPPVRYWSIGDAFLSAYYSVFDLGNNQVGFATLTP